MDASLFLTEVDIHHPKPLLDDNLRAYIVQHSLFFDKLLVGDSQFNNNPNFRKLMWEKEANTQPVSYPQDLWELAEKGFLVPIVRNEYGSLTALYKNHALRKVEHLPSEEYVHIMDSKLGDKVEIYNIRDVSVAFRRSVLDELNSFENVGKGKISNRISLLVKDYVLGQDPLFFDSLQKYMLAKIAAGHMTERDYLLVDRLVAGAYRVSLPNSLNKLFDVSASQSGHIYPITITMGKIENLPPITQSKKINIKPSVIFSKTALSQIPAKALIEVKNNSSRYKYIVSTLENFRTTGDLEMEKFTGELEEYLAEVEYTFFDFLTSRQKTDIQRLKQKEYTKVVLNSGMEIGLSLLSFIPFASVVSFAVNSIGFINAAHGTISRIRSVDKTSSLAKEVYILGRTNPPEKLYEIKK